MFERALMVDQKPRRGEEDMLVARATSTAAAAVAAAAAAAAIMALATSGLFLSDCDILSRS